MKIVFSALLVLSLHIYSPNAFGLNLNIEECNSVSIKYDEPDFAETEEERIIRMDLQLEALLNSFEECVQATNLSLSEISNQSKSSESASASNSASGSEIIIETQDDASELASINVDEKDSIIPENIPQSDNGSTPKDIPDISTDDTTARQLRAVADSEKDPLLKDIYWDEYRKYKGIKLKD